ncbi:hypothetical protein [Streptomyces echinatus]|uniref:hypothetical protein n=1 Tax=Streptomyces echinatus TaxID=67293 RepID=UPI0031E78A81
MCRRPASSPWPSSPRSPTRHRRQDRPGAAAATADGEFRVVLPTALGMAAGLLIALRLPRGQARPAPVTGSPDAPRASSAGRGEPGVPDRAGSGNP